MDNIIRAYSEDVNMCDSCEWCFAECEAVDITFGEYQDNIISCDQYSGSEHE